MSNNKSKQTNVYHRYKDFEILYRNLTNTYQGLIISALPDKNYFKNDSEVIDHRKKHLTDWLKSLISNDKIRNDDFFNLFIE